VGRNRPSCVMAPSPCPVLLYSSCPWIGIRFIARITEECMARLIVV
jgi:hypothetical protein